MVAVAAAIDSAGQQYNATGSGPYTLTMPIGTDGPNPSGIRNLTPGNISATLTGNGLQGFLDIPTQTLVSSVTVDIPSGSSAMFVYRDAASGWVPYIGNNMNTDYLIEVAKGNIPGASLVHKFGRNDDVPSGSWELVAVLSAATDFLSAPSTVRIKAGGDANDTAAGTGAREVSVTGLDILHTEVTETIATAGASASSATTKQFIRVYRSFVSAVGTYGGKNAGDVVIEDSAGTTDLNMIMEDEGQSQYGGFAVAIGTKAYLLGGTITVDSSKAADVKLLKRENLNVVTAPFSPIRLVDYWDGVSGAATFNLAAPIPFDALTDIWFEAKGGANGTEVSVAFELLIVED